MARLDLLRFLCTRLDTALPEQFFYGSFFGDDWKGDKLLPCGTTACAFGLAPTVPEIAAAGLDLDAVQIGSYCDRDRTYEPMFIVRGKKYLPSQSIQAAADIFELTQEEASYLFVPGACLFDLIDGDELPDAPDQHATAQDVAKHIRNFIVWKRVQEND